MSRFIRTRSPSEKCLDEVFVMTLKYIVNYYCTHIQSQQNNK